MPYLTHSELIDQVLTQSIQGTVASTDNCYKTMDFKAPPLV